MYDGLVGYLEGKRSSPWLVQVKINSKKVIVVFLKVIMEDFDDFLHMASRVKAFIWYFMSGGRFSIILTISSRAKEEEPDDNDGSIIGYTHKGRGTIIVLMARGFSER